MEASSSFRRALLKNMLVSLGGLLPSKKSMTLAERKSAIKLSADVAAAAARGGRANWSRALIGDLCRREESKALVAAGLLGRSPLQQERRWWWARPRGGVAKMSRTIVRRSLAGARRKRRVKKGGAAASGAVRKKARVLKKLVPGGERLEGGYYSLLGEALDYVVHLKAQVDLLRTLSDAVEALNGSSSAAGGEGLSVF